MVLNRLHTIVKNEEIVLEAPGCVKIEAEVFHCRCISRPRGRFGVRRMVGCDFLSGLNGEIYALARAKGICGQRRTSIIGDRIIANENVNFLHPDLKLWGVARIFEERSIVRAKWRRWNEDRVSGNVPVSDDDDDNDFSDIFDGIPVVILQF